MPLRPAPTCKARRNTRWNTRHRNSSADEIQLVELVAYVAAEVTSDLPVQSRPRIPIVVRRRVGGNACRIRNAQKKGKYPGIVRIADIRQHVPQPVDRPGVAYSTDIALGPGKETRTGSVVVMVRKADTAFFKSVAQRRPPAGGELSAGFCLRSVELRILRPTSEYQVHSPRYSMPIQQVHQLSVEIRPTDAGIAECLISVSNSNLVSTADQVVVAPLRGYLAAVNESEAVVNEVNQAIGASKRHRRTRAQRLRDVGQRNISEARLLLK